MEGDKIDEVLCGCWHWGWRSWALGITREFRLFGLYFLNFRSNIRVLGRIWDLFQHRHPIHEHCPAEQGLTTVKTHFIASATYMYSIKNGQPQQLCTGFSLWGVCSRLFMQILCKFRSTIFWLFWPYSSLIFLLKQCRTFSAKHADKEQLNVYMLRICQQTPHEDIKEQILDPQCSQFLRVCLFSRAT